MYFTDETRSHAIIPNSETEVKWRCYQYCLTLVKIQFQSPSKVRLIGQYAFARASSLMEIELPPSLQIIRNNAFHNCTSLISINIPSEVSIIGPAAFLHCTSLLSVKVESPSSLTRIYDTAFCQCSSLISMSLPLKGLTYIGPRGFYGCSSLLSIALPPKNNDITNNATVSSTEEYTYNRSNSNDPSFLVESKAFTGCHELQRVINDGYEECSIMTSQSSSDITEWLRCRFDNLPLHQICYETNVTIDTLQNGMAMAMTLENENHIYNNTLSTSNANIMDVAVVVDKMGMTPLHILICNSNVTIELVQFLLHERPELRTKETIQGLSAIDLYLIIHNLESFGTTLNQRKQRQDYDTPATTTTTTTTTTTISSRINRQQMRFSLNKAIEMGLSWKHIEFVSVLDPSIHKEQSSLDFQSGLFPFLKAAMCRNCSLEVIYNLAKNNIHNFV